MNRWGLLGLNPGTRWCHRALPALTRRHRRAPTQHQRQHQSRGCRLRRRPRLGRPRQEVQPPRRGRRIHSPQSLCSRHGPSSHPSHRRSHRRNISPSSRSRSTTASRSTSQGTSHITSHRRRRSSSISVSKASNHHARPLETSGRRRTRRHSARLSRRQQGRRPRCRRHPWERHREGATRCLAPSLVPARRTSPVKFGESTSLQREVIMTSWISWA